ncbi:hypothetical protein TW95_gp1766 [Pandoravirus inopinatum]|uniref:Uncharacterized protein n=1 Tax=Pandoravirus inopinatum TaxID=1605721 RepID=A0A0B5J949_9VIRU|nr:hypothetical protein TW95_gp1766 [Pandoravirus inopinatum]AJF98500.1 hypothetical protein [Pandoravirus inopinatum]
MPLFRRCPIFFKRKKGEASWVASRKGTGAGHLCLCVGAPLFSRAISFYTAFSWGFVLSARHVCFARVCSGRALGNKSTGTTDGVAWRSVLVTRIEKKRKQIERK